MDLDDGTNGRLEIVALGLGCVEDFDGVQPARHLRVRREGCGMRGMKGGVRWAACEGRRVEGGV